MKNIFCRKLRYECSISHHQIWCAHAIVVQRLHALASKMPSFSLQVRINFSNLCIRFGVSRKPRPRKLRPQTQKLRSSLPEFGILKTQIWKTWRSKFSEWQSDCYLKECTIQTYSKERLYQMQRWSSGYWEQIPLKEKTRRISKAP